MKVGSLVECIDNSNFEEDVKLNTPYTIREILDIGSVVYSTSSMCFACGEVGVRLEGIFPVCNAFNYIWHDMPFPINRFRELQLPGEVAEVLNKELELV